MSLKSLSVQELRTVKGLVIVFAVLVLLVMAGFLFEVSAYAANMASSLSIDDGAGNSVVRFDLEDGVVVDSSISQNTPPSYADEVWIPGDAEDVSWLASGLVVGYQVRGEAEDWLEEIAERMELRGWQQAEVEGLGTARAFYKGEGSCRYALVACSSVDKNVTVVMYLEGAER